MHVLPLDFHQHLSIIPLHKESCKFRVMYELIRSYICVKIILKEATLKMLKNCPECGLQVSSVAFICPHCGYPLKSQQAQKTYRKPSKRRRLPNGFGQISELKGKNLRKPFRAMITVGKDPSGKPISQLLKPQAYFETYNEAYEALIEYHKDPYKVSPTITMEELYDKWFKSIEKDKSTKYLRDTQNSWNYVSSIYKCEVGTIRVRHIKEALLNAQVIRNNKIKQATPDIQSKIKTVFNYMLDYAVECGIVDHNYARDCTGLDFYKDIERDEHIPYTHEELDKLWQHIGKIQDIDTMLINCYSGWRPQELLNIKLTDVDLDKWTFFGGAKTQAGRNRTVPIHTRIRSLVQTKYQQAQKMGSPYLFNYTRKLSYRQYYDHISFVVETLGLNPDHRPHDCRKTFVTLAKEYHVDEYAIKYLVGHVITDLTERVYTKRDISWLAEEIEKIK